jgi:transcriptional regulator with XRE-family HTH domain
MKMSFGERVILLRKKKNWTQAELGEFVGTSRDLIGRYERDEIKPSIEVAAKIAEGLNGSLDYLVRGINADTTVIPEQLIAVLTKMEKLSPTDKTHIHAVIEAFIIKAKLQSVMEQ